MRRLAAFAALSLGAAAAHGHDSAEAAEFPFAHLLLVLLVASGALHLIGTARLWRRAGVGRGISRGAVARWWAGWAVLCVALLSPIDQWGTRLFWVHMVQHELLMVVAAPLLVTGRPLEAWTWGLAPAWRNALGRLRLPLLTRVWTNVTGVRGAWSLHAAALWIWHVPIFFALAVLDDGIHTLQHASFLGTALLFWWSVLPRAGRQPQAAALISLFTTMLHSGALGALLTFAPRPWYAPYGGGPGLSALEDQQLGGLIMWAPGGLAYLLAGLAFVAIWLTPRPGRRPA